MGFAATVARVLLLTARNNDLVFQVNLLSENMLQLQSVATRLITIGGNLLPGTPQAQLLQSRQAVLAQLSKGIEVQLELVKSQQRAVTTELDSVNKVLQDNITRSFKAFGT